MEPSQTQVSKVRWTILKHFPLMLMNFRRVEIHTYICSESFLLYLFLFSFLLRDSPFLPSFHIVSSSLPALHSSPIFFPPCVSSAVTSHLPRHPPHTLFVPPSRRSFSEGGRDSEGRTCSPSKRLAATNAGNKMSSEDKQAIELTSCYNPLNAGKMEAKSLLSSWLIDSCCLQGAS